MLRKRMTSLLLLVLLTMACSLASRGPSNTPTREAPQKIDTPTSWPTRTLKLTPTPTRILEPPPAPTERPTATAAPDAGLTTTGLIYALSNGLWQIGADGKPSQLTDQSYGTAVSPDGSRLLVTSNETNSQGLWLVDLKTGQRHNLVENLGRVACCPVWWPSRPDWVLFQSWAPGDEAPDAGYLTAARLDGQEQRLIDSKNRSVGLPAPAPDGRTIAYDSGGQVWLYDWDSGLRQFDPQTYGLQNIQRIASPAWSPDGKQLAWYVGGDFGQGWQVGIAVFDLEIHQGRLLHVHSNLGRGGWFAAPTWSPDGRWLAFTTEDQDSAQAGLWIASADGQTERLLSHKAPPVWSPDGRWLAVGQKLYEVGTWQSQLLNLPAGANIVAWVPSPK